MHARGTGKVLRQNSAFKETLRVLDRRLSAQQDAHQEPVRSRNETPLDFLTRSLKIDGYCLGLLVIFPRARVSEAELILYFSRLKASDNEQNSL